MDKKINSYCNSRHSGIFLIQTMGPSCFFLFIFAVLVVLNLRCAKDASHQEPLSFSSKTVHPSGPFESKATGCIKGENALKHVQVLSDFAPRHPGTTGVEKTRTYIYETLKSYGLAPQYHRFTAYTPHEAYAKVPMANISVDMGAKDQPMVIIGGHFDGKIIEKGIFRGANDGGSSTGLLLEMARCLALHPPAQTTVQLVFFDGEEAFVKWSDKDSLYGSKQFVAGLLETGKNKKVSAMVNVDMIGDKRLRLFNESLSTGWVMAILKDTANQLGYRDLFTGPRAAIGDDHQPFLDIGIPAANLIDFRYGPGWTSNAYWHTEQDTIDKLSPQSIEIVGQIVSESIRRLAKSGIEK